MFNLPKEILIWDSEWTCWRGSAERGFTKPQEHRELVQLGALLITTDSNFKELDYFQVFIKPKINSKLSKYFTELTGITQTEVDQEGIDFPHASRNFQNWAKDRPLYSWTLTDRDVLMENCRLHRMILPFNFYNFFDIRMIFWKKGVAAEKYHSGSIPRAFNKKPKYREHNAVDDARNIVDGLRLLSRISP